MAGVGVGCIAVAENLVVAVVDIVVAVDIAADCIVVGHGVLGFGDC